MKKRLRILEAALCELQNECLRNKAACVNIACRRILEHYHGPDQDLNFLVTQFPENLGPNIQIEVADEAEANHVVEELYWYGFEARVVPGTHFVILITR